MGVGGDHYGQLVTGDAGNVGDHVLERMNVRGCRYQIGALQEMVGIAEVDEFLALLVDRHERHVPHSGRRRGLDFAGGEIGYELERRTDLLGQRVAQVDGDAAVTAARGRILERIERRRCGSIGDRRAQLAGRGELLDRGAVVLRDGAHTGRQEREQCSHYSEITHGRLLFCGPRRADAPPPACASLAFIVREPQAVCYRDCRCAGQGAAGCGCGAPVGRNWNARSHYRRGRHDRAQAHRTSRPRRRAQ